MDEMGTLTMSSKELNRLEVLGRVLERRLTQVQAAEQLGLAFSPTRSEGVRANSEAEAVSGRAESASPGTDRHEIPDEIPLGARALGARYKSLSSKPFA